MANQNTRSSFTKILNFVNLAHIPGPSGLYFFNYVKHFQKNILEAFTRVNTEYGEIGSFSWPMNSIIIYSPELIKSVLIENSKNYIKGEQIEELRAVIGNGIATNNNYESWLKSRGLLAREFNNKSVTVFLNEFKKLANERFDLWKGSNFELDLCHEMKLLTFEIACSTLLGEKLSSEEADQVNDAVHFTSVVTYERIFQLFPIPYWLPTQKNFLFNKHFNNLDSIVLRLIRNEKLNPNLNAKSVLQKLVHAKDEETQFSFSEIELRDEVLTLMLAGHETSAHSLAWIFGLLAEHQSIQQNLFEEIKNFNSEYTIDYLDNFNYLKNIMLEAMRLYPAFPVLSRKSAVDTQIGIYKLPKNTNVVIPIFVTQRSELYWKDALVFNPDRFLDPSAEKSYAYLPFSRGPRRCIAEIFAMNEMGIIIIELIKRFEIQLSNGSLPLPEAFVSLKPIGGMPLKFTKRA